MNFLHCIFFGEGGGVKQVICEFNICKINQHEFFALYLGVGGGEKRVICDALYS